MLQDFKMHRITCKLYDVFFFHNNELSSINVQHLSQVLRSAKDEGVSGKTPAADIRLLSPVLLFSPAQGLHCLRVVKDLLAN